MPRPPHLAAAILALLAGTLHASPARPDASSSARAQPAVDPLDILGRDFAGLRLPAAPVRGEIEFAARSASIWIEASGDGRRTQRVFLREGVRVMLADHTFEGDSAVVWLERIDGASGLTPTYQVFVYLVGAGSSGGDAATSLRADRLSVEAVVEASAPVRVKADIPGEGRPQDGVVREGERELARYLRELVTGEPAPMDDLADEAGGVPGVEGAGRGWGPAVAEGGLTEGVVRMAEVEDAGETIFAEDAVVSFDPGEATLVSSADERAMLFTRGVRAQVWDRASGRLMQLTAGRGVVFLEPGGVEGLGSLGVKDVRGIFLEGDVHVTDGKYTLRGPRVYYDVRRDRALVVDAVFWTYDADRRMPLYVRADAIRQESGRQFVAERATIANTRFARPHFSVGARSVTVTRTRRADGTESARVDAQGVTGRAGSFPFFYWPRWRGDPDRVPLHDVRVESSSRTGPAWKTTWDVASLLGLDLPDAVGIDLLADYYNERGFALGTTVAWDRGDIRGNIFAYGLFDDTGTDLMRPGTRIERDGGERGLILAENRWRLNTLWTLTAEGSYIGDERLVDALFEEMSESRRELTTRAHLRRLDDNAMLAFEAKTSLNDFIANDYLLESRGYSVEKLPEATYVRIGDDLLADLRPGVLTLNSEYRLGYLGMNFHEPSAGEIGFTRPSLSELAFGIDPAESIADTLRAAGLHESGVARFDTRQELSAVFNAGRLRINPFLVGRATGYDNDFEALSPDEDENVRLWAGGGVRLSTTVQRVDNGVESRAFDLHRVRHIIEPGLTAWHGGGNVDSADLPVYDERVEALSEGTMVRAGLDQTWQTKRGGPGRWRNVDVLKVRTEYVWASGDVDRSSPIGRWFEDRPELSNPGEFIDAELLWQATDPVGVMGRIIYDIEETRQPEYSTLGMVIDHGGGLRTGLGQRFVNELDSTLIYFTADYELTQKYRLAFGANFDTTADDFERLSVGFTRLFPNLTFSVGYSFNNITDESSLGFVVRPIGLRGGLGLRGGSESQRGSDLGG